MSVQFESAIRTNISEAEAAQVHMKRSSPSNLTPLERKAVTSLSRDQNITIFPADKGRCTVVLNTIHYHRKITNGALKRDPTNNYMKKVTDHLQDLEKDKVIDHPFYHRLYPGE